MIQFLRLSAFGVACYVVVIGAVWAYSGRSPLPEIAQQFARLVLRISAALGG